MTLIEKYQTQGVVLRPSTSAKNTIVAPSGVIAQRIKLGKVSDGGLELYNGTSEGFPRFAFHADGFKTGPGATAVDTELKRIAPVGVATTGGWTDGPGRRFDQLGFFNVKDYGAKGDATTNDRAAIQAAIDACSTAGGGTVFFPKGDYMVDTTTVGLSIPNEKAILLQGSGYAVSVAQSSTRIRRQGTGTATLISNPDVTDERCRAHFKDLVVHGHGVAGARVVHIKRGGNMHWTRCIINNATATGTVPSCEFQALWNCWFISCQWHSSGGGLTSPSVRLTGIPGTLGENTNTVHFAECEWENNTGTDIELTGDATSGKCQAIGFTNCKLESAFSRGAADTFPLMRLGYCTGIMVACSFFYLGSGLAPLLLQDDAAADANTFSACSFEGNSAQAGTKYLVDQQQGNLALTGCQFANYSASLTSSWHIGSAVGAGKAVDEAGIYYDDAPAKRYVDDRTIKTGPRYEDSFQIAKIPVKAASVGNLTISGPGATIDGVTMVVGDRFLAKDQTTETQNGIYRWTGAATAATRTLDADEGIELRGGVSIGVEDGTKNKDTVWLLVTNGIPTVGSSTIRFSRTQPAYARGADLDPWAAGSAISETFQRENATTAVPLTDNVMHFCGGCVIPANRLVTNINVYCVVVGTSYVAHWLAIVRQSDRAVLQRTANSTSLMTINAVNTRALQATYTAPVDVPVWVVIGWDGSTVPQLAGTPVGQAPLNFATPILCGNNASAPTTTPPAVGAVLTAPSAGRTQNIYAYLT